MSFVYYLFKGAKFTSLALTILNRGNQILIFIAEIAIFCLFIDSNSLTYYDTLGWLICGSLLLALVLELLYMVVLQILKIRDILKIVRGWCVQLKEWLRKESVRPKQRLRRRERGHDRTSQGIVVNNPIRIHSRNRQLQRNIAI